MEIWLAVFDGNCVARRVLLLKNLPNYDSKSLEERALRSCLASELLLGL